jgi:hypothetical protein
MLKTEISNKESIKVKVGNQPINFALEGFPKNTSFMFRGAIQSGTTALGNLIPNMSKADVLVEGEGYVYSDSKVRAFSSVNTDPDGVYPSLLSNFDLTASSILPVKYKTPMSALQGGFSANGGDGSTPVNVGGNLSAIQVTNDINPSATKVLLAYGDSTFAPTTDDILNKEDYWMFLLRTWLSTNTSNKEVWRVVKKAIGGKTSIDFDKLLKTGRLNLPQEDLILWGFGINDQSQNTGNPTAGIANYIAAFKRFYTAKRINNPNSVIVYLGPTPVQLNSRETALSSYRVALATEISKMISNTDASNPLGKPDTMLFGIDLSLAFDRTSLTPGPYGPYTSTDGTGGDALHPGTVAAQYAIFNKIANGANFNGTSTNFGGILPAGGLNQLIAAKKFSI